MGIIINGQNDTIGPVDNTMSLLGTVSIGGTMTIEDFTNIDSVGLITARNGVNVTAGDVNLTSGNLALASATPMVVASNGSGSLRLGAGGSEKVRITSNGRVGIDSTTPHRQLVVGDGGDISCLGENGGIYFGTSTGGFRNNGAIARAQQAGYHVSGSQVGDLVMAPEADKDLIISSGSTNTMYERLRVTTGGNIGINDSGPNFHLDVNGNIALREGQVLTWHDGSGNKAGDVYMDSSDSFVIRNTSSVTERLRIDNTGRVTISGQGLKLTTNNSSLYSLDGSLSYYATNNGVYLNGAGTNGWLRLNASGAENNQNAINIFGGSAGAHIDMRTNNVERFRIASDGKIHIGGNGTATDQVNVIAAGGGINISRMNSGNASVNEWLGALGFKGYATGNSSSGADARIHANAAFNHSGTSAPANLIFSTKGTSTGPGSAPTERMRITYDGALLHKGNNQYTIDNTDGDGQASSGYPAGGATFNKNISVNNNAGGFGQCMNMISHTKVVTLNGSTNHDMVSIYNREGCFIGHVYAGYSTSGDGAVAMYKFNTFYSANSIIAELGPSGRSSDSISVSISSSGDTHTFRVNGNGYSGDVTIGLVFLSAGVAGSSAHYGVRYY